jgi:hypothetical protein
MATEYHLKNNPLTPNRLYKLAKNLIQESKEDRTKALETFEYFKGKVEEGVLAENDNANSTAQKCMIDCLKLAQDSRNKTLKALDLVFKASKLVADSGDKDTEDSDVKFDDLFNE